jgi:hypothetical protein
MAVRNGPDAVTDDILNNDLAYPVGPQVYPVTC